MFSVPSQVLRKIEKEAICSRRMDVQKQGLEKEYRTSRTMDDENHRSNVLSRLGGRVNIVHYEHNENDEDLVILDIDYKRESLDFDFVKAVYAGGDINMDAYKGMVDTGALKTVAGKAWLEAFTEDSPWMDIRRYKENETFRFCNWPAYISRLGYIIPVTFGKLKI